MVCLKNAPLTQYESMEFINELIKGGYSYNQSLIIKELKKDIILER